MGPGLVPLTGKKAYPYRVPLTFWQVFTTTIIAKLLNQLNNVPVFANDTMPIAASLIVC